ncbi:MAG: HAD family hydrolase, partial [Bacteroidota bacterium]
ELNSMPHALKYYHMYWDTFLDHMELFPNAENFLKEQKELGHKTCLLTDLTAEIQYRKVERLGIGDYIDFIVTSEEVGVEKPHPTMFLKALGKLGCEAEEAIMIGDSWDKDIVGASVLGIDSIWINHNGKQKEIPSNVSVVSKFEQISLK